MLFMKVTSNSNDNPSTWYSYSNRFGTAQKIQNKTKNDCGKRDEHRSAANNFLNDNARMNGTWLSIPWILTTVIIPVVCNHASSHAWSTRGYEFGDGQLYNGGDICLIQYPPLVLVAIILDCERGSSLLLDSLLLLEFSRQRRSLHPFTIDADSATEWVSAGSFPQIPFSPPLIGAIPRAVWLLSITQPRVSYKSLRAANPCILERAI